jgi:KipI family sensor histidine kinase inhibitor
MTTARVLPYGECAVLLEVGDVAEALGLHESLRDADLAGLVDLVPAMRTVLAVFASARDLDRALPILRAAEVTRSTGEHGGHVTIDVTYDGPDLEAVAESVGVPVAEVVRRHTGSSYVTAFIGFAPGFAYLTGLDPSLHLPRLETPRTRVPAGSVAIAGEFAAVYPRESPGGWRLLGRTDAPLWDLARDEPALLRPGTHVTFREPGR